MLKKLNESFKEKINKTILIIAFILYILILIWIVIFKANYYIGLRKSIFEMVNYNFFERFMDQFNFSKYTIPSNYIELFLNIVIFIPLTLYLPLLFSKISFKRDILIVFIITFIIEIFQLLVGLGGFEILDLILNLLGGIIGYIVFKGLKPRTSDQIINYINLFTIIIFLPITIFAITNTIIHYDYYVPFFSADNFKNLFNFN